MVDATWGMNFDDERGNVAVSLSLETDTGILYGDRDWSRDNGIASVGPRANPSTDPNAPPRAVVENPTFWLTSQAGSIAPTFGAEALPTSTSTTTALLTAKSRKVAEWVI